MDRAGLVGADGPTHQGAFDIPYLRCIPNMVIMTPSDEQECRNMLYTGHLCQQPASVRYPRGSGMGVDVDPKMQVLALGKSRQLRQTKAKAQKVAILNFGSLLPEAIEAANKIDASLLDMRFVKPLDNEAVLQIAKEHDLIVTLEDGAIKGGAGSAVMECLHANKTLVHVLTLGLPDEFIMQGTQQEMYEELGIDAKGIMQSISDFYLA